MSDQKINILLVDDRPENLLAIEAVLMSPKYNLVRAYSGIDALKLVLTYNFALILLDVQMPGLDGFETAKLIRQRKKSQNVPIVFITAINHANEYVVQGYKQGAVDYIIKPFDPDTLKLKIQGYLKTYQDRETLERLVQERTSELILANEKLKKAHRKVANILESIKDAFFTLDCDWRFTYINEEFAKLYGKRVGQNIWEVLPALVDTKVYEVLNRAMNEQILVRLETPFSDLNSWFELSAYPSEEGLSVYLRDITQRRQMEQEMARLDRLNLIGQMAAGIGHEVRNPMTIVRGFLQMLSSKPKYHADNEYFNLMISELDRANTIITEFLSVARNSPTQLQLHNLSQIIQELFPLLQTDALNSDKNLEIQMQPTPDININKNEIYQLILNLVRNGLEAMQKGGCVTIKTFVDGEDVVLTIKDEGSGIEPDILDKLGTPFLTTKDKGTGLGLATCFSIAKRHNAGIDVDTSSSGTTFMVRFKQN